MNFNDKIKELMAFSKDFGDFKNLIEDKLKEPEKIKNKDELLFEIDSARRAYGEQIAILKSYVDKRLVEIDGKLAEINSKL